MKKLSLTFLALSSDVISGFFKEKNSLGFIRVFAAQNLRVFCARFTGIQEVDICKSGR